MKILRYTLPIILLIVSSCKDSFFEVTPRGQITADNFFQTQEHAILATNAVYNVLRNWEIHVFAFVGCTDIISDDADKGSEPNDAAFLSEIDNFQFNANNVAPVTVWTGYYRAIFRANIAIERIPEIKMDATLQKRLIAESQFLRAYFYFNLVRWFGDVPLVTKQLTQDEFKQSRAKTTDIYAQIITDLKAAIDALPEKSQYPAADLGRATKGAARGLLAKVYLTTKDYTNAEKYATDVINSKRIQFTARLHQNFHARR